MDPQGTIMSTDEMSVLLSFINDHKTLNNLSLCNKAIHQQVHHVVNALANDHENPQKLIKFWRGKSIDPLLAFTYLKEQKGITLPSYADKLLSSSNFHVDLFCKAFDRSPGGNVDAFILMWRILFANNEVKVWRCSARNWDGSYYAYNPFWSKERKPNWPQLLKSLMKQSIKQKSVVYTQLVPSFDSDEYDTDWAQIQAQVFVNSEKILDFTKKIVTEEDDDINPMSKKSGRGKKKPKKKSSSDESAQIDHSSPEIILKQIKEFCQVKLPVNESDDFEDEYGSMSKSGKEFRKGAKSQQLDEDDPDCDDDYHSIYANHLEQIIERIKKIEPVEPKQAKVSNDDEDGEEEENDDEENDEENEEDEE